MEEAQPIERTPLEQFKLDAKAQLPGLLAFFDFADTKRRNSHLGHNIVDEEIDEFDRLLHASVGAGGVAKRVGGESWLALMPNATVETLAEMLTKYQLEQIIEIGWQCTGEKDGKTKVARRTVESIISRALRCICCKVTRDHDIAKAIEALREQYCELPPNIPVLLSEVGSYKRSYWQCITSYPIEKPFCPFCQKRDFQYEDGDTRVYSGSGICKNCMAEFDIRGVEILKN